MMAGTKSICRNLKNEDEAVKRNIELHEKDLWGLEASAAAPVGSDDLMDIMAARDVNIYQTAPPGQAATAAQPTTPQPAPVAPGVAPPTSSSTLANLAKYAALAAALGSSGGLGAYVATRLASPATPAVDPYELRLLPPTAADTK